MLTMMIQSFLSMKISNAKKSVSDKPNVDINFKISICLSGFYSICTTSLLLIKQILFFLRTVLMQS